MDYIGANEEGEATEPFEHVTYVSFRRVDLDASDVTATAKRDALSGDVDLNALRPTGATIKAAPVSMPDEDELAADDLVIEMESLVTGVATSTTRPTRSSAPPPLPPRASRPSMPPTVRASLPATARAPSFPPTMPELPETLPMLEADPPATVPSAAMTMRSFPPPPPPPHMAFPPPPPPHTAPLPPAVQVAPAYVPPAYVPRAPVAFPYPTQVETPSTAPVAMAAASLSFGYEAPRKGLRLSPTALVGLVLLLVGSTVAFGTVLVVRNRAHALASTPQEPPPAAAAPMVPAPASAEPVAVPTIAPAALPSVVVGVEALPKASSTHPDMTLLSSPPSAKGHRIFVDGRVVGTGGTALKTKCGDRTVKVGSAGKPRLVHLPCGGELALD